jgi:hypothetical protein
MADIAQASDVFTAMLHAIDAKDWITAHSLAPGERRFGGDIWMVAGHYKVRFVLQGNSSKIAGITLTPFYQDGNTAVPELARTRARSAR